MKINPPQEAEGLLKRVALKAAWKANDTNNKTAVVHWSKAKELLEQAIKEIKKAEAEE